MKRKNEFIDMAAFASTVNIVNTMSGGLSEPQIRVEKQADAQMVYAKAPGVPLENLKVAVDNNILTITHLMGIQSPSQDALISLPRIIFSGVVPYFVEVESITASYENDRLVIRLPFNEKADGYHRLIEINRP